MALAVCASAYGCGAFTTDSARDVRVGKNGKGPPVTQVEVQQDVQRFASQFIDRMNQAFTPLAEEGEPHRREIALRLGVAYLSSALDIASGPYPEINLVDMIVFMKLSGDALETHWIPVTFGDEGRELLKAFRQSETQIWEISDKVLADDVQETVRNLIVDWQAKHPGQFKVESVRFNEFAERAGEVSAERQRQARGIFGQVRQVTQTADEGLLLAERGMFLANRMPTLIRLQARLGVYETTSDALSRLGNVQQVADQLPALKPLLEQSTALMHDAVLTVRESEELAVAWRPYLDWLSDRGHPGEEPVSLHDSLESANRLTDNSLTLVRELKGAAPKDGTAVLDQLEGRLDRIAKRGLLYLILLGFAWSVLFWGGYLVVKRFAS